MEIATAVQTRDAIGPVHARNAAGTGNGSQGRKTSASGPSARATRRAAEREGHAARRRARGDERDEEAGEHGQHHVHGVGRKDANARAGGNEASRRRAGERDGAERDPRGERRPCGSEQGYNNGNSTWGKRPAPSRARANS